MHRTVSDSRRRAVLKALAGATAAAAGGLLPLAQARAALAASRTVTYYDGICVTVPGTIRRVATAWEAENSIIAMLGYGDRIVGTTRIAQQIPAFRRFVPSIRDAAVISTGGARDVNVELLIALHPDLLLVADHFPAAKREPLERAGIAVAELHAQSLDALIERTLITGRLLGDDAYGRALAYRDYFNHNRQRVAERLAHVPASRRLKVYLASGAPLRTSSRPSLDQDWMDLAGAINVAEHWQLAGRGFGAANTNVEAVLAADPDVIVCLHAADVAAIRGDARWQGIKAVRTGRVLANPRGLFWWCRETTEEALQFLWLAGVLYPEAFSDCDG